MELRVEGAEKLARVSKALKQAGDKDLQRELRQGITRAVKPLKKNAKAEARNILPSGGGLGRRVARTSLAHSQRGGQRNPGVRVTAKPGAVADPLRINRGRVRHPTFGGPPWVLQNVPRGWFTKPMEEGAPAVRKEIVKAVDAVAAKINRTV